MQINKHFKNTRFVNQMVKNHFVEVFMSPCNLNAKHAKNGDAIHKMLSITITIKTPLMIKDSPKVMGSYPFTIHVIGDDTTSKIFFHIHYTIHEVIANISVLLRLLIINRGPHTAKCSTDC